MNRLLHLPLALLSACLVAACSISLPPSDLDVRLTRPTEHAMYIVTMKPLVPTPPINQIHAWEIGITDSAGVPIADAKVAFSGGMPQHRHGYPTQPAVTAYLGEGRYRLGGVKFSMSGWWEMKLNVQSARGSDIVVFNTVVSPSATAAGGGTQ